MCHSCFLCPAAICTLRRRLCLEEVRLKLRPKAPLTKVISMSLVLNNTSSASPTGAGWLWQPWRQRARQKSGLHGRKCFVQPPLETQQVGIKMPSQKFHAPNIPSASASAASAALHGKCRMRTRSIKEVRCFSLLNRGVLFNSLKSTIFSVGGPLHFGSLAASRS